MSRHARMDEKICSMFSVAGRRLVHLFFENPAEIQGIVVPHHRADLLDRIVGAFQQHPRPVEADGGDILHRRHPHCQPETANEPAYTDMLVFCVFLNGNGFGKVFVEIMDRLLDFFWNPHAVRSAFQGMAADRHQKLPEQKNQQFFVAGTAKLQFLDHLEKKLVVFRQDSSVQDSFPVKTCLAQKVRNLFSGKMHPADFCFAGSRVFVILWLAGSINDERAGRSRKGTAAFLKDGGSTENV